MGLRRSLFSLFDSRAIKAVCGLVDAPADFDEHFGKVGVNLSDKFRSLGLGRLMTGLAAFQSKLSDVMMWEKQMDDGILVGPSNARDTTLATVGVVNANSWETGQTWDFKSSRLRNPSAVLCPVLVLGAALLYILRM